MSFPRSILSFPRRRESTSVKSKLLESYMLRAHLLFLLIEPVKNFDQFVLILVATN